MSWKIHSILPIFFLLFLSFLHQANSQADKLDQSHYANSCPQYANIVRESVRTALQNDTKIAASLLRLHFLDCFLNGCDASILLDDTKDFKGEKNAIPNINSARVFELIDNTKTILEEKCPSTVSCADLLTLATRDAVSWAGGPTYSIPLGRRDGLTASAIEAIKQLPSPSDSLPSMIAKFQAKGFDLSDFVTLSGAHTIGLARCSTFNGRLYNFKGSGKSDPALSSSALSYFRGLCPKRDSSNINRAPLDWGSPYRFDNTYYKNLMNNNGLLESDQALIGDPRTFNLVRDYSNNYFLFLSNFATSIRRLGSFEVLTGDDGQIRKNCRFVN